LNLIPGVQQQHTKSALTSILDLFLLSEVATMQQIDSIVHKLKPKLFHKSAYLQVYLTDFHSWYELCLTNNSISNLNIILVIPDTSIKNNIITLISHIHNGWNIIAKTIHYVMHVTSISTKVKLFLIKNQFSYSSSKC